MNILKNFLAEVYAIGKMPLDEQEIDAFVKIAHKKVATAKELLHEPGKPFDQIWLLKEGMVRAYAMKDTTLDYTINFFTNGQFVWDYGGLDHALPDQHGYEALFPTTYYYWLKEDCDAYLEKYPHWRRWRRMCTEMVFLNAVERLRAFLSMSLVERYSTLLDVHGDLINKVPQYHIASYLGAKPQSLSRIKNSLSNFQKEKP